MHLPHGLSRTFQTAYSGLGRVVVISMRGAGWFRRYELRPSKTIKRTNPWRNSRVELQEDDPGDAHVCVDDTEQHAERIERLYDDDAAFDRGTHCEGRLVVHQPRMLRIPPAPEEHDTKQEQIEPIYHQGKAICDVLG